MEGTVKKNMEPLGDIHILNICSSEGTVAQQQHSNLYFFPKYFLLPFPPLLWGRWVSEITAKKSILGCEVSRTP